MMNQNRQDRQFATKPWTSLTGFGLLTAVLLSLLVTGPVPEAKAQRMSEEMQERVRSSMLFMTSWVSEKTEADTFVGGGYAFFINRTGLCITVNSAVDPAHLMDRRQRQALQYRVLNRVLYRAYLPREGEEESVKYPAKIKYQNERANIAILQVYEDMEYSDFLETPNFLRIRDGNTVEPGTPIWLWGDPLSMKMEKVSTSGDWSPVFRRSYAPVMEILRRVDGDIKSIVIDYLVPVMIAESEDRVSYWSGGPAVDDKGNVIGSATHLSSIFRLQLVPGSLMRDCISTAFLREKLDRAGMLYDGIDLEPFYSLLVDVDGYMAIPTLERSRDTDCIYLGDGQKLCGTPTTKVLTIPSTLGELKIPCDEIAYLLPQDDEFGIVLLDGGQRFPFYSSDLTLEFQLPQGQKYEVDFANTKAVAFRNGRTQPKHPTGKGLLLEGPDYSLNIKEPQGETIFTVEDADVDLTLNLEKVRSIETFEYSPELQFVKLTNGTKAAGEFSEDATITVRIPTHGAEQDISLKNVFDAKINPIDFEKRFSFVRDINDIFPKFVTPEMKEVAQLIDDGKLKDAEKRLENMSESGVTGVRLRLMRSQIQFLNGITQWRLGNYKKAKKFLKKARNSEDVFCRQYSKAILAIYDRWPNGKFDDGKHLSDKNVFQLAASQLAMEYKNKALDTLAGRELVDIRQMVWKDEFPSRSQFMRSRKLYRDSRENLDISSLLGDPLADWIKIQILSIEKEVFLAETWRLELKLEQETEELTERELRKLEENLETTRKWAEEVDKEIEKMGFINADPDMLNVRVIEVPATENKETPQNQ